MDYSKEVDLSKKMELSDEMDLSKKIELSDEMNFSKKMDCSKKKKKGYNVSQFDDNVSHSDNHLYRKPLIKENSIIRCKECEKLNNSCNIKIDNNSDQTLTGIENLKIYHSNGYIINKVIPGIQVNASAIEFRRFDNGEENEFNIEKYKDIEKDEDEDVNLSSSESFVVEEEDLDIVIYNNCLNDEEKLYIKKIEDHKELLNSVIFVQTCLRTFLAKKKIEQEKLILKLRSKRIKLVMELYATEINYVDHLKDVVDLFLKPLRAIFDDPDKKEDITKETIETIFGNVDKLLPLHQKFLDELKEIVNYWNDDTLLSPIYKIIHSNLSLYTEYFENYKKSYLTLKECMDIPLFEASIKTIERIEKLEKNDLISLLIRPIQRIPRYILLFKEILKYTWTTHPDYQGLKAITLEIENDMKHINKYQQFTESKGVIESLHSQVKKQNMNMNNGKYISEGSVLFQYCEMNKKAKPPQQSYMFLFNNMILLTKYVDNQFKLTVRNSIIKAFPLNNFVISKSGQINDSNFKFHMSIIFNNESILTLYFKNDEQKKKWYDDFYYILNQVHSGMSEIFTIRDKSSSTYTKETKLNKDDKKRINKLLEKLSFRNNSKLENKNRIEEGEEEEEDEEGERKRGKLVIEEEKEDSNIE